MRIHCTRFVCNPFTYCSGEAGLCPPADRAGRCATATLKQMVYRLQCVKARTRERVFSYKLRLWIDSHMACGFNSFHFYLSPSLHLLRSGKSSVAPQAYKMCAAHMLEWAWGTCDMSTRSHAGVRGRSGNQTVAQLERHNSCRAASLVLVLRNVSVGPSCPAAGRGVACDRMRGHARYS